MLQEAVSTILQSLAVQMNDEQKSAFAAHVQEQLEERVGEAIAELVSDEQLEEYMDIIETGSDEQIKAWLEVNVPDYKEVISDEVDILVGEIAESSERL